MIAAIYVWLRRQLEGLGREANASEPWRPGVVPDRRRASIN
jgi:hypothetical protein